MIVWILLAFCAILLLGFPFLTFHFIKKFKESAEEKEAKNEYPELKASILYLQTAFPTILLLLGMLGFTTYKVVLDKVTEKVTNQVFADIQRDKIVRWQKEIENYREKSESNFEAIQAIYLNTMDSIRTIANQSFLHLLPKGTIIPYSGRRDSIDFNYWAICDGTKGTPNLKDRFILGGTFAKLGTRGGTSNHSHSASTVPQGKVDKRNRLAFPHFDGSGKKYDVERHDHSFQGIKSPVTVSRSDHLPPYVQLVFLMKIK